jgi:hypothetical protein
LGDEVLDRADLRFEKALAHKIKRVAGRARRGCARVGFPVGTRFSRRFCISGRPRTRTESRARLIFARNTSKAFTRFVTLVHPPDVIVERYLKLFDPQKEPATLAGC